MDSNRMDSVTTQVFSGTLYASDVWDNKSRWADRERASRKAWETLTPEKQAEIKEHINNSIARMTDRLDEWLPSAYTPEIDDNGSLEGWCVDFRIMFVNLENLEGE